MNRRPQNGFSLVELAIVLLIMGLVLGGLAMPMSVQRENARIRDNADQLDMISKALEGFAMANGYLPCPSTPASAGTADVSGGGCSRQHGFVPATSLNLTGTRNEDNLLLDAWGAPVRYSVSASDTDSDGNWDFTAPGEMQSVTMSALSPDLSVCSTGIGASASACANAAVTLASQSPAIVYSLGKDWTQFSSADQLENVGAAVAGGASGRSYPVASNTVFVSRGRSDKPSEEFDDHLVWLSAAGLYRALVDAGQLP